MQLLRELEHRYERTTLSASVVAPPRSRTDAMVFLLFQVAYARAGDAEGSRWARETAEARLAQPLPRGSRPPDHPVYTALLAHADAAAGGPLPESQPEGLLQRYQYSLLLEASFLLEPGPVLEPMAVFEASEHPPESERHHRAALHRVRRGEPGGPPSAELALSEEAVAGRLAREHFEAALRLLRRAPHVVSDHFGAAFLADLAGDLDAAALRSVTPALGQVYDAYTTASYFALSVVAVMDGLLCGALRLHERGLA